MIQRQKEKEEYMMSLRPVLVTNLKLERLNIKDLIQQTIKPYNIIKPQITKHIDG